MLDPLPLSWEVCLRMLGPQPVAFAEEDREYLMGGGRWHDDGAFVAGRPHWLTWRYLLQSRRRQLAAPTTGLRPGARLH
jgi:hypothetical protein